MPRTTERIDIRVLGSISISVDGHEVALTPVERHLVALLVAGGPSGLSTENLADQLWPETLPDSWRASFRNNVSRLNKKVAASHRDGAKLISERAQERRLLVERSAVDLWRLQAWASDPDRVSADLVETDPALLAGAPFPNCELSPLLRQSADMVAADRRDIVNFWAKQGKRLPYRLLAALRQLNLEDPYNEPLAEAVVELHLAVDEHKLAADLLEELLAEVPLSEALTELRQTLQQRRRPHDLGPTTRRATFPRHSPFVAQVAAGSFAGRADLLEELSSVSRSGVRGILVHGDGGIGKTRLVAELASQLGMVGHHTAYVVADRQCFGSLQPFLDAFPELGPKIEEYLPNLNDMSTQALCRQAIRAHLSVTYAGYPLCLVIDDIHWLDDQTSALAVSLARAGLPDGLFIIGVGRAGDQDQRWSGWLGELTRAGLQQFKVRPIEQHEMVEMIRTVHGDLEQIRAQSLASQLLDLSSGIPGVARWLLERVDMQTMSIHTDEVEGTGYAAMVNNLGPDLRQCGAVASVLGRQFTADDLARLVQVGRHPITDLNRKLEELTTSGLIVEQAVPGVYRFAHILAAEAFEQSMAAQDRTGYHAMAFELFPDPIRRAGHAEVAAPSIGARPAAEALVASARVHSGEGHYGATIANLQAAVRVHQPTVTIHDRIMLTEAMERSGVRAGTERDLLVTEAIGAGDMTLALEAASTGLPDTEAFEGDLARVKVLQRIDPNQLSNDEQVRFHVQLTRQLLLVGRLDEAQRHAALATGCAETVDQQAQAWLARRLTTGFGHPVDPNEAWPPTTEIVSDELRLRISQARAVDAIATGGSRSDWPTIAGHVERAAAQPFPQLHWFSLVSLATALSDQGELDDAREAVDRAHQLGLQSGIRVAEGTYQVQLFVWELIAKSHGRLYPYIVDGGPDDLSANIIYDAALAASHTAFAQDDHERRRANDRVRSVCNRALQSSFDLAAIGIMADAIADTGDERLMGWASERLSSRNGAYVLVASAGSNLGPCSALTAKLEPDRRAAAELLEQAVAQADDDELALWQVLTRLDLAECLGQGDPASGLRLAQARDLASTSWLKRLVTDRRQKSPSSDD